MDLAEQWPKHYKVTAYKNLENWKCSSKLTYLDREFCYIGHFLRDANLTFNCVLLHRCKQNNNKNSPSAQTQPLGASHVQWQVNLSFNQSFMFRTGKELCQQQMSSSLLHRSPRPSCCQSKSFCCCKKWSESRFRVIGI